MLYPISWICESKSVRDFLNSQYAMPNANDFLIADFASGENDNIPNFIHRVLPDLLPDLDFSRRRTITYSTDLHGLRLDSLYSLFQEREIVGFARAVHARLESMVSEASFREEQSDYLQAHQDELTVLYKRIINERRIGSDIFDLGFLNNDVIGYLFEYYKAYTDALASLEAVRKTLRPGGLLIVTQPCSLYPVNNFDVLKRVGFSFVEGFDFDLKTGESISIDESVELGALSRLGHYTFLILRKA